MKLTKVIPINGRRIVFEMTDCGSMRNDVDKGVFVAVLSEIGSFPMEHETFYGLKFDDDGISFDNGVTIPIDTLYKHGCEPEIIDETMEGMTCRGVANRLTRYGITENADEHVLIHLKKKRRHKHILKRGSEQDAAQKRTERP